MYRLYRFLVPAGLTGLLLLGCLFLFTGGFASPATANPAPGFEPSHGFVLGQPGDAVTPVLALDHASVLVGSEQDLYLLLHFDVPQPADTQRPDRPPLNVALVIDRSGSMSETHKITHARAAALRFIDAMAPTDILGVVEYDDQISVLWPSVPLTSPETVKRLVAQLEPRGATNLAGGLQRGLAEASRQARSGSVNRVLLLSDGLANTGITDPREIARFVRDARRQGLTVSTLGVGLGYNEDLMQAVAEVGGGNYYYVEDPGQMAAIFDQELSTLATTVAQDVRLRFRLGGAVHSLDVLGYEVARGGEGNSAEGDVTLENLYGGERRTVLCRLRVRADAPGRTPLGSIVLSYTDQRGNRPVSASAELVVDATRSPEAVAASLDRLAGAEAALMTADEEHEQYVRQYERGEKDAALANIGTLSQKLQQANAVFQDKRLEKKQEHLQMESEEMRQADLNARNRQVYLKGSKERFYQSKRGSRGKYLLQEEDRGREVERLQTRLQELGLYSGAIDGAYDADVARAVSEYQRNHGLEADGIAGPATLKSLALY